MFKRTNKVGRIVFYPLRPIQVSNPTVEKLGHSSKMVNRIIKRQKSQGASRRSMASPKNRNSVEHMQNLIEFPHVVSSLSEKLINCRNIKV